MAKTKKDQVNEEKKKQKHRLTNFDRISAYESSNETLMALGHHNIIRNVIYLVEISFLFFFSPSDSMVFPRSFVICFKLVKFLGPRLDIFNSLCTVHCARHMIEGLVYRGCL